ncbi:MAG: pectinesterase family protein [Treponemataceae bacterium]|nr:pectinesterase family protein [Treponemataceae bacterium]
MHLQVDASGRADFSSIQAAIDAIPLGTRDPVYIFIKKGVYTEKIVMNRPQVHLIGEDPQTTIIRWGDYAKKQFPDGRPYQTFNSYTIFIGGDYCSARHITFENTAGPGDQVGQAIAAYVDGDGCYFEDCHFIGWQDTLFTGPLPLAPLIPGSFTGPREQSPRWDTSQYYKQCTIMGDIDFIFGSALAVFDSCRIISRCRKEIVGYITAPSTPQGRRAGYIFLRCSLEGTEQVPSTYLGRPWRNYGRCVFLECFMGSHIMPQGWHNWDKKEAEGTVVFGEYKNEGPGAQPFHRVPWALQLNSSEAASYYTLASTVHVKCTGHISQKAGM